MNKDEFEKMLYEWVLERLRDFGGGRGPFLLGINGPQGGGKSTVTRLLVQRLAESHHRAVTISIDDFYLTRSEQVQLAARHKANPYLQQRGYPGTHDVKLGETILGQLKGGPRQEVHCPLYDKSAFDGQGDRAPRDQWKKISGPLDVIFFEGWMLGFSALPDDSNLESSMKTINGFLPSYEKWTRFLDGFIHLEAEQINFVVDWRIEAEEKMKAQGKTGMTLEEVRNYIQKFLPAYQVYVPQLRAHPPVSRNYLHLLIGKNRLPR